jgi:hypothetical protein
MEDLDVIDLDPIYMVAGFCGIVALLAGVMWYFSEGNK